MTDDNVAIPAREYYAKRARYYLAQRAMDEQVLAAVPAYPAGTTQATLAKDIGGLVGSVAGAGSLDGMMIGRTLGRQAATTMNRRLGGGIVRAEIKIPKRSILVLTSERLLFFGIFRMGFFTGKPKRDAAVDIPIADVLAVSEPVLKSGGAVKVLRIDVGVWNRGFVRMEVPQGAAKPAGALAAELARRVELLNVDPGTGDAALADG